MISNITQQQHLNYDKRIIVTEKVITEKLPTLNSSSITNLHNNYDKNFKMIESTIASPTSVRQQSNLVFINNFQQFNGKNNNFIDTNIETKLSKEDTEKQNKNNLTFIDSTKIQINIKNSDIIMDNSNASIIKYLETKNLSSNLNSNEKISKSKQLAKLKNLAPLDLKNFTSNENNSAFIKLTPSNICTTVTVSSPTLSLDSNKSINSPITKSSIIFPNYPTVPIKISTNAISEKDASAICNGWKTLKSNNLKYDCVNDADTKISHSYQRSVIEDVHNYSKKSPTNSYEALSTPSSTSSCSSVNGSIDGDVDDDDYNNVDGFYESDNNDNQNNNNNLMKTNTNFNLRCRNQNMPQNNGVVAKGVKTSKRNLKKCETDTQSNNLTAPMHHARRPMNAFLIFCKRHRGIVKNRFNNVENRQITKILGDWWENLSVEAKSCYNNLAKDYKDAFLSANPNFQWYKLPAPPLRTLSTTIVSSLKPIPLSPTTMPEIKEEIKDEEGEGEGGGEREAETEADIQIEDENIPELQCEKTADKQEIGVFKFADETQMGGLSSLISAVSEQQKSLSPTNLKRKLNDINDIPNKKFHRDNSFSSSGEDDLKPTRSCKGKKYLELINSGQIGLVCNKKILKKNNLSNCEQQLKINGNFSSDSEQNFMENAIMQDNTIEKKPFDSNDFDLESKILSLPAQDLEQYLARKDDEKSKKQIKIKRHVGKKYKYTREKKKKSEVKNLVPIEQNDQQELQKLKQQQIQHQINTVTGSQKRKARKESITRRDISSIQQENPNQILHFVKDDGQIEIMEIKIEPIETEKTSFDNNFNNNGNCDNNVKWNLISPSDLSILAEVASNVIE